jgi:translation initiation factor 2 beta subunit (eIF-2beta)/eIF-5
MEMKESQTSKNWQEAFSTTTSLASEYAMEIAMTEFPFLRLPVIRQIFTFIINRIVSKIQNEGKLAISFNFTNNEISQQLSKYNEAIEKLKKADEINNPEMKEAIINDAKDTLRNLIRFPK